MNGLVNIDSNDIYYNYDDRTQFNVDFDRYNNNIELYYYKRKMDDNAGINAALKIIFTSGIGGLMGYLSINNILYFNKIAPDDSLGYTFYYSGLLLSSGLSISITGIIIRYILKNTKLNDDKIITSLSLIKNNNNEYMFKIISKYMFFREKN